MMEQDILQPKQVSAGKAHEEFRNYESSSRQEIVERHYRLMRTNQTLAYVQRMHEKYNACEHDEMTIREAFRKLESYIDSSDPDSDSPNLEHMMQTAERIRADGHPDWFQLTGLLHDMGKICFLWGNKEDGQEGTADGDQWALGGDTWAVGCRIPDEVVFPEFNQLNPDMKDPKLSSALGIYETGCGLDNVLFAYGHDEYMYRMLKANNTSLPDEALAMIRYHSCYPWHQGGAYEALMTPRDHEMKKWVLLFNQYDLYTKSDAKPDVEALWPYYQSLIDKYLPGKLRW
ncbi:Inositol oxygenase [Hondaea fermentalgiana]|uniref:Inositol oxygenase n=1 Tax=Hondaea fermentalgiana TaxID=2315210 RepID=A0A2R5GDF0_9STRA|nr:Inositol oxygenase [Hondaea fermentalgiana]|eukprot:GBG25834.1 Inositol oxygenase [Hondaea fermentalgiana]